MNSKLFTLLTVLFIAIGASAVDVTQCPKHIAFRADVDKVHKNSIYSHVPGWKEAQKALSDITSVEVRYTLKSKTAQACAYADFDGNRATLSTASFQDPEERNPSLVDQLVVNLVIDGSDFVSFIPVKAYGLNGIVPHSSPYRLKIKAQLVLNQRLVPIDIGMINTYMK